MTKLRSLTTQEAEALTSQYYQEIVGTCTGESLRLGMSLAAVIHQLALDAVQTDGATASMFANTHAEMFYNYLGWVQAILWAAGVRKFEEFKLLRPAPTTDTPT